MGEVIFAPTIEDPRFYWAGNDGGVYSLRRGRAIRLGESMSRANGRGYATVHINDKTHHVHRVVCGAFFGPCPAGRECSHTDGNRLNNQPINLRWESRERNHQRSLEHGSTPRGELRWNAKFTEDEIREVRARSAAGETYFALADEFGCTFSNIGMIVRRDTWAHV